MARACWSSVFTATNRMVVGRNAASTMASASAASCLTRDEWFHVDRWGKRTEWQSFSSSRPQPCAVAQASMATTQLGCWAKNTSSCPRESFLRNTTDPSARAPCNWKTHFARSMPMMVTSDRDVLSVCDGFNTHHIGILRCRQEGASTPSRKPVGRKNYRLIMY